MAQGRQGMTDGEGRTPLDWMAKGLLALGSIWTVALMGLIVADVIGRSFLDRPITGVAEIAARSVAAIVFLQVSAAILSQRLTQADFLLLLLQHYNPGLVRALNVVFALTSALVFGLILYAAWPGTVTTLQTGEFFGVQGVFTIPLWPFRMILCAGAGLALLSSLLVAFRFLTGRVQA